MDKGRVLCFNRMREQRGKVKGKGSREAKKERGDKEAER